MPGRNTIDNDTPGHDDMTEPEHGFNDEADPVILATLAHSIAGSAADAEEALDMCSDLATGENLNTSQFLDLIGLVENATGWELPEQGEPF